MRVSTLNRTRTTFSFLYRNERTATRKHNHSPAGVNRLSVSSIGTNELQPQRTWDKFYSAWTFQFPLSERTNCNRITTFARQSFAILSVSSIGTNELQHAQRSSPDKPSTDFQFPLSERTNCNTTSRARCQAYRFSFSFLYRNERTATSRRRDRASADPVAFSFLYRNERTATCNRLESVFYMHHLSVSSIGTNELQRVSFVLPNEGFYRLSVSSIGTNELQH